MITVLYPIPRETFWVSSTWTDHLNRPGYKREYAGTDFASHEQPLRGSQYGGKVLQSMWSDKGYGYTTFVDYGGVLRIRNAHQKDLAVNIGDAVTPNTNLGTLDTTGNSTGNHTHFEVWIKYDEGWRNVDPFDPSMGVKLVNDMNLLEPLGEVIQPLPPAQFVIPDIPDLPQVKPTALITKWINLRSLPQINSYDLGDVRPGEKWQVTGSSIDGQGNIWLAVKRDTRVGWAAAYYNGQTWLEFV